MKSEVLHYAMVEALLVRADRAWVSNDAFQLAHTSDHFPTKELV
jgi:Protein of unknown function (DUF1524)